MFKFGTRNRQLQLHNGVVSYEVSAESSRFNVRSSVDFSRTDRSLQLKFYSAPGRLSIVLCVHRTSYMSILCSISLVSVLNAGASILRGLGEQSPTFLKVGFTDWSFWVTYF